MAFQVRSLKAWDEEWVAIEGCILYTVQATITGNCVGATRAHHFAGDDGRQECREPGQKPNGRKWEEGREYRLIA